MQKGAGKAKGSAFERQIAKELSLWISAGADKDLLWRTALSGGRASTGKSTCGFGDLGIAKESPRVKEFLSVFCVECKNYQEVSITKAFHNEKNPLWAWWEQVHTEAHKAKVRPMLIAKGSRQNTLLILDSVLAFLVLPQKIKAVLYFDSKRSVLIVDYNEFLAAYDWKDVYRNMKGFPV